MFHTGPNLVLLHVNSLSSSLAIVNGRAYRFADDTSAINVEDSVGNAAKVGTDIACRMKNFFALNNCKTGVVPLSMNKSNSKNSKRVLYSFDI